MNDVFKTLFNGSAGSLEPRGPGGGLEVLRLGVQDLCLFFCCYVFFTCCLLTPCFFDMCFVICFCLFVRDTIC